MAHLTTIEAAMLEATASHKPVERPHMVPVTREQSAAARADLDARARAGKTVQGRNNKGHFTRGVKVFTAGVAAVAQVPAKVEKRAEVTRHPVTVERDHRASVVVLSAGA